MKSSMRRASSLEKAGGSGIEALRARLAAGEDPDAKDATGIPQISAFAAAGDLEALAALAAAGADLDALDAKGFSPLAYALEGRRPESVSKLLELGANPDPESRSFPPLAHAVASRLPKAVEALLAAGADPNRRTNADHPPLAVAVRHLEVASAKALIAAGADIHARIERAGGAAGFDALGMVVRESLAGNPDQGRALELAEALLAGGADPNAPWGPAKRLSLAVCCGSEARRPWVRLLLRAGADPDARDGSGACARDVAMRGGASAMLEEEIAAEAARREEAEIYGSVGEGKRPERRTP